MSFYEERLAQSGYEEGGSSDIGTLVMNKGGAWALDVVITKKDKPTNISIVFPK